MFFSVIIPTYNRLDYLPSALESVWAQTLCAYEIIVVDDGSTDGTRDYLATLSGRVNVVTQMNRGPGCARNAGAMQARGEFLAFLDSDDHWFPWALAVYSEVIQQCKNPVMIAASVIEYMQSEALVTGDDRSLVFESFANYLAASKMAYHVGAGMGVYRADAFRNVGGFITQNINGEDHDLALRLGDAGAFVQICSPHTLAYRRHQQSATADCHKTQAGASYLIKQEQSGVYPGKRFQERARREIITRHVRPASLECLRRGMAGEAWRLYRNSFRWHVTLGRWKYLLGFVYYWVLSVLGCKRKLPTI